MHRGVYELGAETTERYEGARAAVARFIGAGSDREIVFTKNVTEALNLVAYTWGRANLPRGRRRRAHQIEHHANLVPWLMLQEERGIELRWIPLADDFTLDLSGLDRLVDGAKLVGVSAMSNVLGTLTPVRQIADAAHAAGALCLVDGAQRVPHLPTDVGDLGCDFLGFTGHKMLGPTGIGVLWGRPELLDAMPPFLGGGEMIRDVRLDGFTTNDVPWKFEAGTPPIAEAIGLGRAVDYLEALGMDNVRAHEVAPHRLRAAHADRALRRPADHPRSDRRHRSAAACSRSPSATCTPTTSARCSTSTACAFGPGTIAPSR